MDFLIQILKNSWRHVLYLIQMKLGEIKDYKNRHDHQKLLRDWLRIDLDMIFWKFAPC